LQRRKLLRDLLVSTVSPQVSSKATYLIEQVKLERKHFQIGREPERMSPFNTKRKKSALASWAGTTTPARRISRLEGMAKGTTSGTPVPSYRTTDELGADSKTDTIGFESSVWSQGYGYRPESTFTGHGLLNQSDNRFTTSKTENPMIEESPAAKLSKLDYNNLS